MTNYESRDYLIPIHTSDNKTLYFSKHILIHRCDMVKMLNKHNQCHELNVPFDSSILIELFEFIELEKLPNLQHFCFVADYFQYMNNDAMMKKDNLIDFLIEQYECPDFIKFYKYVKTHDLIPKDLNETSIEQLFLDLKPFKHPEIANQEINWIDIVDVFQAPLFLKESYMSLMFKIENAVQTLMEYIHVSPVQIDFKSAQDRYNTYLDSYNDFMKKYEYKYVSISKGFNYIG